MVPIKIDPDSIPSPNFYKGTIFAMKNIDCEISLKFVVLSNEHNCKTDQKKAHSLIYVSTLLLADSSICKLDRSSNRLGLIIE